MKGKKDKKSSKFFEWLEAKEWQDNDIMDPPMGAQTAVYMLADYLLGEDWYSFANITVEQVNTEIVYCILMKYSKKFRKECRRREYSE